jgi:hypothetical protein
MQRLTVACNHEKLIVLVDVVYLDVWEGSDYLLLGWEIGALLELKITNGTRQSEVTIDTSKINEAACRLDTRLLGYELLAQKKHRLGTTHPRFAACGQTRGALPCLLHPGQSVSLQHWPVCVRWQYMAGVLDSTYAVDFVF